MSVGQQMTKATMDQALTNAAVALRNACSVIRNLNSQVNGASAGLAYLQGIGYGSAANPANPGGVSDAQYALNILAYESNVAGCYFGTVQQGGTGGTGAILFPFDNALAPMWGGQ